MEEVEVGVEVKENNFFVYKTYTIQERFNSLTASAQSSILSRLGIFEVSALEGAIHSVRVALNSSTSTSIFFAKEKNLILLPLLWKIEPPKPDEGFNQMLAMDYYITRYSLVEPDKCHIVIKNTESLAYAQLCFINRKIDLKTNKYNFFGANLVGMKLMVSCTGMEANFSQANLRMSTIFFTGKFGTFNFSGADLKGATLRAISALETSFNFTGSELKNAKLVGCDLRKMGITTDQLLSVDYLYNCSLPENNINSLTLQQKVQLEQKVMEGLIFHQITQLDIIPDIFWDEQDISQIPIDDRNFIIAKYHVTQVLGASYLACLDDLILNKSTVYPEFIYEKLDQKFKDSAAFRTHLQRQLEDIIDRYEQSWWWPFRWLKNWLFPLHKKRNQHLLVLKQLRETPRDDVVEITRVLMNIYNEIRQEENWFKSTLLSAIEESSQALLENPSEEKIVISRKATEPLTQVVPTQKIQPTVLTVATKQTAKVEVVMEGYPALAFNPKI